MDQKIFLSAFSKEKNWRKETAEIITKIKTGLAGNACDLVVFFVSEPFKNFDPQAFSRMLTEGLACRFSIGCNASGIIGDQREVEMEPALTVLAMHLPGVKFYPFVMSGNDLDNIKDGTGLINFLDVYPPDKPRFICLADSVTCDMDNLLSAFNDGYKGLPVIGGISSGDVARATNWLSLNGSHYSEGAIGLALTGNIEFDIMVSQGCRPIGRPLVITKADGNILYELAGKTALEVIREVLEKLPPRDRALSESSLFAGLVMNENQTSFKRGDFLIRNIVGFDPESGSLMITADLKVGHTLQFQLRDAETSAEDLKFMLGKLKDPGSASPKGALLISCCGRGHSLYGKPDHDVRLVQSMKGPLPLTGFFANGEIGPVGNKNYVHGYTSSLVILH